MGKRENNVAAFVEVLKKNTNKYIQTKDIAKEIGVNESWIWNNSTRIKEMYPDNITSARGFGYKWSEPVVESEKPNPIKNQEHYTDMTPYLALKEKSSYVDSRDILPDTIWRVSNTQGEELFFVLSSDDVFVHGIRVQTSDPKHECMLIDTDIKDDYYVNPDRVTMKPAKYFIKETTLCPEHETIKRIREQVGASLGCYIERTNTVEKIVEKEADSKKDDLGIALMKQKIDIYESVLKAQGLLL